MPKDRTLNYFPPTAATSIHGLFFTPLYRGATIVMDPRTSEKDFYNQIVKQKPNIVFITGSAWDSFFKKIESELGRGRSVDFGYASYWIVGGEGTDIKKICRWNHIIKTNGNGKAIYSGYGQSELFSATCEESPAARYDFSKPIMSVGIPYAGITMGVFDKELFRIEKV